MKTFSDFGIIIPTGKLSETGYIKVICPRCNQRKGGRLKDKDLSVNIQRGTWHCHSGNCGWEGRLNENTLKKTYIKPPEWKNNTNASINVVKWFETERKISQATINKLRITSSSEFMPQTGKQENTINFNYFFQNELINVKYRDRQKNFKLFKDAELILYNLDSIIDVAEAVIVEGEIDVCSFVEAGIEFVVSVPNGANKKSNNTTYLDYYYDLFNDKEFIYIGVDADAAGIQLREELIRRFGAERCKIIDYSIFSFENKEGIMQRCKDANEVLVYHGKEALRECYTKARFLKIDGIFEVADVASNMRETFFYGKVRGSTTYINKLDKHFTHRKGEVTLVTGYNNEGKSNFLYHLLMRKAKNTGEKVAAFMPENLPIEDCFDDFAHNYAGMSTDPYYKNQMPVELYDEALEFINNHFFVIDPPDDYTIDTILEKAVFLIKRKGIHTLVLDPYNQIETTLSEKLEHLAISKFMTKLKRFAIKYNIAIFLVAHQVTPNIAGRTDYPEPNKYSIKGGGTFADKADNVIIIWRPNMLSDPSSPLVLVIVQKIKKQRLVGIPGRIEMFYSPKKNQYFEDQYSCEHDSIFCDGGYVMNDSVDVPVPF